MSFKVQCAKSFKWQLFLGPKPQEVLQFESDQLCEVPDEVPEATALEWIELGLAQYVDGSDTEVDELDGVVEEVDELDEVIEEPKVEIEEKPAPKRRTRKPKAE